MSTSARYYRAGAAFNWYSGIEVVLPPPLDPFQVYSQNGEDGILQALFGYFGTTNKRFVEFGAEDGAEDGADGGDVLHSLFLHPVSPPFTTHFGAFSDLLQVIFCPEHSKIGRK